MPDSVAASASRVFLIPNGAQPGNSPAYQGFWRAGTLSWSQGTSTPVRRPSDTQYRRFTTIDSIPGEQGLPELGITALYTFDLSDMLEFIRKGNCNHDLQIHFGECGNPKDFNGGYSKVLILETAKISDYGTSELGAMDQGEDAATNETPTWQGQDAYEVVKLNATEMAASIITREIVAVAVCDSPDCGGVCGVASDGCGKVFMVSLSAGGSPGIPADVIYTSDGGSNWLETNITTLATNEDPDDAMCVGDNLVVVSDDSLSLHYADKDDIINGVATWSEVGTGFVAGKGPLAIWSLGPNETWIVGTAGYIYFSADITSGVTVQNAGVATVQNLTDIHMLDSTHGVAVGASNAVVKTTDGETWAAVTGPIPGTALNAVWMKTKDIWLVGSAAGVLYYTNNAGISWTTKGFGGSGAGAVHDINFVTPSVGYLAHATAAAVGRILRTIDGGQSWAVMPNNGSLGDNDKINSIVACGPNTVFAGGLGANATDGYAVKLSA